MKTHLALPRAARTVGRALRNGLLWASLLASAAHVGVARADPPKVGLGLNLGGHWGEGTLDPPIYDSSENAKFKPFTPRHWFLSTQLGLRGRFVHFGLRAGFNRYAQPASDTNSAFTRALIRVGPFLAPIFWQRQLGPIDLALFAEVAIYVDTLLTWFDDDKDKWRIITPSLGLGADVGVVAGLRIGFYGGVNYNGYVEHRGDAYADEEHSRSFWSGELRGTLLYVFGGKR